jgi:hypothetical protein
MGNVANVIVGSGILYVAPFATAPPSLASLPTEAAWLAAGWKEPGYTDTGVEFDYTPGYKDIRVDEESSPVKRLLDTEALNITAGLAEATIENLNRSITASVFTNPGTGIKTLTVGSLADASIVDIAIAFQGPAPGGATARVIIGWKARVTSSVKLKVQRTDKIVYAVTWSMTADSTQAAGVRLAKVVDYNAGS